MEVSEPTANFAVCTVFESTYHHGVATLVNSLIAGDFRGVVYVGFRGALSGWARDVADAGSTQVAPGVFLRLVELVTTRHLTLHKASFMRYVLADDVTLAGVVYIDPDVVVKCPWVAVSNWLSRERIALVEDVNGSMPHDHPRRLEWVESLRPRGFDLSIPRERYYNGGFVGLPRSQGVFLDVWESLCDVVVEHQGRERHLKVGGPHDLFHSTDQDALNIALAVVDVPLSTVGPEGMDFAPGGHYLSHALGSPKPWDGGFVRRALSGRPPSSAAKQHFRYVSGAIDAYSRGREARLRLSLKVASVFGRFVRRT